jgi:probable F420-dependent oxidoreductase
MQLGVALRNMGPQSQPDGLRAAARAADAAPHVAHLWVADHIAIPPDDAEGSDGRYLDPLATLAHLAGITCRVGLGTAVLVVPYRPALPTAKAVATVQELSGGRLQLGVGVGWMLPEFRALGVPYERRGRLTDELLRFLDRCFAGDVVEANGQPFLFRPRPSRPPLWIGGAPSHAFRRVFRHRAGWMPVGLTPDTLAAPVAELRQQAAAHGVATPEVAVLTRLPLAEPAAARELHAGYVAVGVSHLIHGERYADARAFHVMLERLAAL